MKNIYFFLLLLLVTTFDSYAQTWVFQTVDQGAKPVIAIDSQDRPHFTYMFEGSPGFLKHALLNGGSFQINEAGSAYYHGPSGFAISPTDEPVMTCHNHPNQNEEFYSLDATGQWQATLITSTNHDGWDNAIAFDNLGNIHTSSIDGSSFGALDGLEYAFFDGTTWEKETVIGSGPIAYLFGTSIAIDANNRPHIVYYSEALNTLFYAIKSAGTWSIETVSNTGGMFPYLTLDTNDQAHIAYYKRTGNGNSGSVEYTYKNNGNWLSQSIDSLYNVPIETLGARAVTALKLDSTGKFHLSYGDRDVIKYTTLDMGTWNIQTIVDVSAVPLQLGAQTSLDLDSNDVPHITYFELTSMNPINGNIIYATIESCTSDLIISENMVNGLYEVSNTIITSGNVTIGASAIFSAGQSTSLEADFCVPLGSEFEAIIDGCN